MTTSNSELFLSAFKGGLSCERQIWETAVDLALREIRERQDPHPEQAASYKRGHMQGGEDALERLTSLITSLRSQVNYRESQFLREAVSQLDSTPISSEEGP